MAKKNLSKKSRLLLFEFSEAACDWGWQQDQGTGNSVNVSEKDFNETFKALEKRILYLESKNKELSAFKNKWVVRR